MHDEPPPNVPTKCPDCGARWLTGLPFHSFDCLTCGAKITKKDLETPLVTAVPDNQEPK